MKNAGTKFGGMAVMALLLASHSAAVAEQDQPRDPVSVVASATAAYEAGDRNRFLAHFAEDAIVDANGFSFQGRAQIRDAYAPNFAPDAPSVRVVDREAYDNRVIDTVEYTQNGGTWCCTTTAYFVEDGQITYARVIM